VSCCARKLPMVPQPMSNIRFPARFSIVPIFL
jgi:hypothetical protein